MEWIAVKCKRCFKRFTAAVQLVPEVTTLEPMDLPCSHCGGMARYDWKDYEPAPSDTDEDPE